MENKYLEKASSFLATAAGVHVAQNAATKFLLSSPKFAKSVGNSFVDGVKGVVDKSKITGVKNFFGGMLSPDSVIAKNTAHKLGAKLAPTLQGMNKRQLAALRMASKGNIKPLIRRGLHKDTAVLGAAKAIEGSTKLPIHGILTKAEGNTGKIKDMFNDKNLPLLSNLSKNMSRAKGSVGPKVQPGIAGNKSMLAGSFTSAVFEPTAGLINSTKSLASTERFRATKFGGALSRKVDEMLLKRPTQKGFEATNLNKLKNKAYELSVNPVSANLERTSHAAKSLL